MRVSRQCLLLSEIMICNKVRYNYLLNDILVIQFCFYIERRDNYDVKRHVFSSVKPLSLSDSDLVSLWRHYYVSVRFINLISSECFPLGMVMFITLLQLSDMCCMNMFLLHWENVKITFRRLVHVHWTQMLVYNHFVRNGQKKITR